MEIVVVMLYDGDDGFGAMSFGDEMMVTSFACLIEIPYPLVTPSSLYFI